MKLHTLLLNCTIAASVSLAAMPAMADPLDLALNRLSMYNANSADPTMPMYRFAGGCGTMGVNWATCEPDNQLFANLVNQLAGALAPPLMAPARSIGYNGIYVGYEVSVVNINGDINPVDGGPWRRGTEGVLGASGNNFGTGTSTIRNRMGNAVFVSRLHVRKAFPLGIELGLSANWLHDSGLIGMGLDIRWVPLEGFRYLPDLAFRGSVTTLVGTSQLYMTVVGADASLSKQIAIGGVASITPFLGGQALFVFGDSTVIDGTPDRSAYQECTRREVVFYDANNVDIRTPGAGAPVRSELECRSAAPGAPAGIPGNLNDSHNDMVFNPVRLARARGFGGLRFRYGMFTITAEFGIDLIAPQWLNNSWEVRRDSMGNPTTAPTRNRQTSEPANIRMDEAGGFRQWTVTVGAGVTF